MKPLGEAPFSLVLRLVIGAVDAGFDVVVPRDAVAGTPPDYADAVVDNTLRLPARVVGADDVAAAWAGPGTRGREEEPS